MNIDLPLLLVVLTLFTGVVTFVDYLYRRKYLKSASASKKFPWLIEYARAFFPVLFIVLIIRSFIIQPYHVPSGSLEPTITPGDLIFVTQYNYGLRLPVWRNKVVPVSEPKHGQIVLFNYPVNHQATFVKRAIGLPGDKISYIDKVLYLNGKKAEQKDLGPVVQFNDFGQMVKYEKIQENLDGVVHNILVRPDVPAENFYNLNVPKGEYLMMGDNRDESDDSRSWGFVSDKELIGRAIVIWFSYDKQADWLHKIRWNRIGTKL